MGEEAVVHHNQGGPFASLHYMTNWYMERYDLPYDTLIHLIAPYSGLPRIVIHVELSDPPTPLAMYVEAETLEGLRGCHCHTIGELRDFFYELSTLEGL